MELDDQVFGHEEPCDPGKGSFPVFDVQSWPQSLLLPTAPFDPQSDAQSLDSPGVANGVTTCSSLEADTGSFCFPTPTPDPLLPSPKLREGGGPAQELTIIPYRGPERKRRRATRASPARHWDALVTDKASAATAACTHKLISSRARDLELNATGMVRYTVPSEFSELGRRFVPA